MKHKKIDRRHTVSDEEITAGSSMVWFLGGGERGLHPRACFWLEKKQGIWFGIQTVVKSEHHYLKEKNYIGRKEEDNLRHVVPVQEN